MNLFGNKLSLCRKWTKSHKKEIEAEFLAFESIWAFEKNQTKSQSLSKLLIYTTISSHLMFSQS